MVGQDAVVWQVAAVTRLRVQSIALCTGPSRRARLWELDCKVAGRLLHCHVTCQSVKTDSSTCQLTNPHTP